MITSPGSNRSAVSQQPSLFLWLTMLANVSIGVRRSGIQRSYHMPRAMRRLGKVRLADCERHYFHQLSRGMQQRVQIARALVDEPEVLLMDKALGALDHQTRLRMQKLLLRLREHLCPTILCHHA